MRDFKFSRLGGYNPPIYVVRLGGVVLGTVEATTPSVYPGREKASYKAFPDTTNTLDKARPLGPAPSRQDAAELIVRYLHRFKYGRKKLSKVARAQPKLDKPGALCLYCPHGILKPCGKENH